MEVLSEVGENSFPEEWYEITTAEHFWVRWRFRAMLRQLRGLGLDTTRRLSVLEIGCAHGVVQDQLHRATDWRVDGCDTNRSSLARNTTTAGGVFLYDIFDRRPEMEAAYDVVVLYDVVEHIEEPVSFLEAAHWHLKPGGYVLVNVPALTSLYSRYDEAAGHYRRYDLAGMRTELEASGLTVHDVRYWGFSLLPLLALRKLLISRETKTEAVIRFGFKPPSALVGGILDTLGALETKLVERPFLGTSVMAAATKPTTGQSA